MHYLHPTSTVQEISCLPSSLAYKCTIIYYECSNNFSCYGGLGRSCVGKEYYDKKKVFFLVGYFTSSLEPTIDYTSFQEKN